MEIDRIFISSFSMAATISTLKNVNARVWGFGITGLENRRKIKK
jgi:hypothetical protein